MESTLSSEKSSFTSGRKGIVLLFAFLSEQCAKVLISLGAHILRQDLEGGDVDADRVPLLLEAMP